MPIGTEFRVKFQSGNFEECNIKLTTNNYGELFHWCDDSKVKPYIDLINATFIPIQQPVSFMEAINSGKRIKCVHDRFVSSDKYMSIPQMFQKFYCGADDFPLDLINNGKWYIEESEADSNE